MRLRPLACFLLSACCLAGRCAHAQTAREFDDARQKLVDTAIVAAGVTNERVIEAMRAVPRHLFVPRSQIKDAYKDQSLPIGNGQTISPPYIVAYMTEKLDPQSTDKVLEIGTGSGYQAAVLSRLAAEVYTIEIVEPLARKAEGVLKRTGCKNVQVRAGDGYAGWPENGPFDRIIVTCSPDAPPQPLIDQLKEGGRMIIPVGERFQQTLYLYRKTGGMLVKEALDTTFFVPMTGTAEQVRVNKTDAAEPAIANGSFEDTFGDSAQPAGWYYVRNAVVEEDDRAPKGKRLLTFSNTTPGRGGQALQAFAVDGRKILGLEISFDARGEEIRPDKPREPLHWLLVEFFDKDRVSVGIKRVEAAQGTFAWTRQKERVKVPPLAVLAVLKVGLLDATGELSIDDFQVRPADPPPESGNPQRRDADEG